MINHISKERASKEFHEHILCRKDDDDVTFPIIPLSSSNLITRARNLNEKRRQIRQAKRHMVIKQSKSNNILCSGKKIESTVRSSQHQPSAEKFLEDLNLLLKKNFKSRLVSQISTAQNSFSGVLDNNQNGSYQRKNISVPQNFKIARNAKVIDLLPTMLPVMPDGVVKRYGSSTISHNKNAHHRCLVQMKLLHS